MKENILKIKSYTFAVNVVRICLKLKKEHKEFDMSRQLLRSGTAIGALIRESEFGQSKADFVNKLSIALKEANETDYWLSLLKDVDLMSEADFVLLTDECNQLLRLLISSINTSKASLNR